MSKCSDIETGGLGFSDVLAAMRVKYNKEQFSGDFIIEQWKSN